MKLSIFTKGLAVMTAGLLLASTAIAQNRRVDLEITVAQPQDNAVIAPNANFDFVITIKNNGPDAMVAGDTIFFQSSLSQSVEMATLVNPLAVDASVNQPYTLTNQNATGTDQVANICFILFDPNTEITANNAPVSVSYDDIDTANNKDCAMNITLKTAPTSVEQVTVADQNLVVFPNPATDKVGFRYTAIASEEVLVTISDMLGREVVRQQMGKAIQGNEAHYELDITALKSGNYILSVTNGAVQTVGRLAVK